MNDSSKDVSTNEFAALFGQRLRSVRKQKKMTLEEMARLLETSKQVLSRYENGKRTPKVTVARLYAERLEVPLSYFLGETREPDISLLRGDEDCVMSIIGRGGDQRIFRLSHEEADKMLLLLEVIRPGATARTTSHASR